RSRRQAIAARVRPFPAPRCRFRSWWIERRRVASAWQRQPTRSQCFLHHISRFFSISKNPQSQVVERGLQRADELAEGLAVAPLAFPDEVLAHQLAYIDTEGAG